MAELTERKIDGCRVCGRRGGWPDLVHRRFRPCGACGGRGMDRYKVTRATNCQDFKTALLHPKPDLQPGTYVWGNMFNNFYGTWLTCTAEDGTHYYLNPDHVEYEPLKEPDHA